MPESSCACLQEEARGAGWDKLVLGNDSIAAGFRLLLAPASAEELGATIIQRKADEAAQKAAAAKVAANAVAARAAAEAEKVAQQQLESEKKEEIKLESKRNEFKAKEAVRLKAQEDARLAAEKQVKLEEDAAQIAM